MPTPLAFISYRRADSSAASRWLAHSIALTFGAQSVFIDTEAIRMSDDWAARINEALQASTLFIPVIGPQWLSVTDSHHRRRIDNPNDWVHLEAMQALQTRKRVLPILLSRTPPPTPDALPAALAGLAQRQTFELRDERWATDLDSLLDEMERFGFVRTSPEKVRYPSPKISLNELTPQEIASGLARLPGWRWVETGAGLAGSAQRVELAKTFEFTSFEDAIRFMREAVPQIEKMQHHPRWENVWRSVAVHLTTWDIGHRPSRLDLELAEYLQALRATFPPRR